MSILVIPIWFVLLLVYWTGLSLRIGKSIIEPFSKGLAHDVFLAFIGAGIALVGTIIWDNHKYKREYSDRDRTKIRAIYLAVRKLHDLLGLNRALILGNLRRAQVICEMTNEATLTIVQPALLPIENNTIGMLQDHLPMLFRDSDVFERFVSLDGRIHRMNQMLALERNYFPSGASLKVIFMAERQFIKELTGCRIDTKIAMSILSDELQRLDSQKP